MPWIVASALFMEQLDATIVNTGIPASGWVANRFGTRRVFLSAIVMFTLACGSLVAGYFLSRGATHDAAATVHALHLTFVVMAVLTLCSAWIFRTLDPHDGDSVSRPDGVDSLPSTH